ncbi:MAG: iron complex outermembrane receptor protein [Paraglaciecola sp.]|jgi:iron complex outermembrane receptor protein
MMNHFRIKYLALCLLATGISSTAMAQTTEASASEEQNQNEAAIEMISVTAQRREEQVNDVPVALTVLSSEQLENSFSNKVDDLGIMIPSLSIRKGGTTRNSSIFFRGIGTTTFSVAAEPSTSTVVDGVVLARSGQAFNSLYDIERVEALRGPQGTLFGKNSSGGVLNIITKGPTTEWQNNLSISAFEGDERRVKASVSGPITDTLSTRITVIHDDFDGIDKNLFDGGEVNGYKREGLRAMFDYSPSSDFNLRTIIEFSDAQDNCCGAVQVPEDGDSGRPDIQAWVDAGRTTDRDLVSFTKDKTEAISFTADWLFDEYSLTSISAYRKWNNVEIDDADYNSGVTSVWVNKSNEDTGAVKNSGIGSWQKHVRGDQDTIQLSQEFRLASELSGPFNYQVGLFLWKVDTDRTFIRSSHLLCDQNIAGDVCDTNGLGDLASFDPEATAVMDIGFKSVALFGQGTYEFSDELRLIAGLRWTRDELEYTHDRVNPSGVGAPGIRAEDHHSADSQSTSEPSGRLGLQFDMTLDWMVYGTYARGYKGPAYNVTFSMNPAREPAVGPETADSFELGLKGTLFDDQLFLSVAAYHAEYEGFQASNFILVNGSASSNLTNAGDVTTKGFEIDFVANITKNLRLVGGGAFGNAEFSKFECIAQATGCVSREGESVSFAPDNKASFSLDYQMEINDVLDAHWNTQVAYQSEQWANLGEKDANYLESRSIVNASVGISNKDDSARLTLVIKNLTDKAYATEARSDAGALVALVPRDAERYFGVNYRVSF